MIDYGLLNDSELYYGEKGFVRVEVPWMVSQYVDQLTKPSHQQSYVIEHNQKALVASAEQSFLFQYLKNYLPKGQFQAITPCFRHEQFDALHSNTFMKNELIKTDVVDLNALDFVVDTALIFYRKYLPNAEVVKTPEGYDIQINGTELGSYGIRSRSFLDWIFGTGCAEPRTSNSIKYY